MRLSGGSPDPQRLRRAYIVLNRASKGQIGSMGVRALLRSGENRRMEDEPLLTEPEAAEVLRVSPRTLKRWRLASTGPKVAGYVGRSPRYRRSDLLAYLRRGR
jgi:hypothetical protein